MSFLRNQASAPGFLAAPAQPAQAILFRLSLISFAIFFSRSFSLSSVEVAECRARNGRLLAEDGISREDEGGAARDNRGTALAVAGKVFDLVSNVVAGVGTEVKNSMMYGLAKLRTSERYKKAKYLLTAPDVSTRLVHSRLQKWGIESLRFLNIYIYIPLESREAFMKVAFDRIPQLAKFSRKYVSLAETANAGACYKHLLTLKAMLESAIGALRLQAKMRVAKAIPPLRTFETAAAQLPPGGSLYDPQAVQRDRRAVNASGQTSDDPEIRHAGQLLRMVVQVLPRVLFYHISPFSNSSILGNELSLYLRKMLPTVKQVFALAWRLNSVLPPSSALAYKRMMVDYLDDATEFEQGLRTACEWESGYRKEFNPQDDYYHIPPPEAGVLQAPPLTDTL